MNYADQRGNRTSETADYLLSSGMTKTITREDLISKNHSIDHVARVSYSLADSNYVLQTRFTYSGDLHPSRFYQEREISDLNIYTAVREDYNRSHSPAFDVYFHRDFRHHQQLTTSVTLTHINTKSDNAYDEGFPYRYQVEGRSWSLKSEMLYENQLEPFALTVGMQYNQKYTDNEYIGDAQSSSLFRSSEQYLFSQINGKLGRRLQYSIGLGGSRRYYRQGIHSHDFFVFRPRMNLGIPLAEGLRLNYNYQRSQHTSQIALVNDVTLRVNSMELLMGNPDLKPTTVTEHTLRLNYDRPRLQTRIQGYAKLNHRPNMHRYIRTSEDIFIDTQENQPHCNLMLLDGSLRYDLVPDKFNATLAGIFAHFDNKGNDYHHYFNSFEATMMLNAYLGHWTLMAYADTGWRWMEGERRGKNGVEVQFVASYQTGALSLSLYCRNPFRAHPLVHQAELMNRNLHKLTKLHDSDQGNYLGINITYTLSHGRKYRDINRTITLEDKDAGILKR